MHSKLDLTLLIENLLNMKCQYKKIHLFELFLAILIFAACTKQSNTQAPPKVHQGKKVIDAVLLKTDSTIYIPIEKEGMMVVNHLLPEDLSAYLQAERPLADRFKYSANARYNTLPYAQITSKSGSTYGIYGYTENAVAQINWYLSQDGIRIAYVGTTIQQQPNSKHILNVSHALACNSLYTLEADYTDNGIAYTMITNNFGPFNYITTAGMGNEASGADVKIADINRNGIPDIVMMVNDNPAGPNLYKYQILFDVNPASGISSNISAIKSVAADINEAEGSGLAFGDIDQNGVLDMVLMSYDAPSGPNSFKYKIGFNLSTSGDPAYWSTTIQVSGVSDLGSGASVALADIDHNGILDMALMATDRPSNGIATARVKIGFNLSTTGQTNTWGGTAYYNIASSTSVQGCGMDITTVDQTGQLWLIIMQNDHGSTNTPKARAWALDNSGNTLVNPGTHYFSWEKGMNFGTQSADAGIAFGDINRNGTKDFILMADDNPAGPNSLRYFVGFDMTWDYDTFWTTKWSCN